jgi:predicted CoA-binding protein
MKQAIDTFFSSEAYAVVGVSENRRKFGNIVYRTMLERGYRVFPVNPAHKEISQWKCFASVLDLPDEVKSVVTVVQPAVVERVMTDCLRKGIRSLWMQPGSESRRAIEIAEKSGIDVIHGQCLLMFLEPVRSIHAFHRFVNKLVGAYPR